MKLKIINVSSENFKKLQDFIINPENIIPWGATNKNFIVRLNNCRVNSDANRQETPLTWDIMLEIMESDTHCNPTPRKKILKLFDILGLFPA